MKSKLTIIATLICLIAIISSCSEESSNGPSDNTPKESISLMKEGVEWKADSINVKITEMNPTRWLITTIAAYRKDGERFTLNMTHFDSIGTYYTTPAYRYLFSFTMQTKMPSDTVKKYYVGDSTSSITITRITETEIEGTFSSSVKNEDDNIPFPISNGHFKIKRPK